MKNEREGRNKKLLTSSIAILCTCILTMFTNVLANNAEDKPAESPAVSVPRQMERFIKFQAIDSGMNYNMLKRTVQKDQLPLLYELLSNDEYAPYWQNIVTMIGYISDDPNSVPVLLDYFKRDDRKKVESDTGKFNSIWVIGKIGGDKADPILKKAITKEGAEELAKSWIDQAEWKKSDKEYTIKRIRSAAIQGLVYTGKKENWDIIEKLYNEQMEIFQKKQSNSDIFSALITAMATKAIILDNNNDVEAYFRIDSQAKFSYLKPYLDKYDPHIAIIKSQAETP